MKHLNTYRKAINQDLSPRQYSNENYYDAEWMSPTINESGRLLSVTNPKGTISKIELPSGYKIIGHCGLRNWLILISVFKDNSGNESTFIYKFKDDGTLDPQFPGTSNFVEIYNDFELTGSDKLGYSQNDKLEIVSRYETSDIQKIYFCDTGSKTPLRHLNIINDPTFNNISSFTQSDFNIITKVSLSNIIMDGYTAGNLKSGKTCYAYQMYRKSGPETSFSPTSRLITVSSTINKNYISKIKGSDIGENTGVGIKLLIEDLDPSFSRIRVLAFDYADQFSNPSIRIIYEGEVSGDRISIIDNGDTLGTYDISTFRLFNQFYIKPGLLETKNNILFAGKIEEEYFNLDKYLQDTGQDSLLSTDPETNEKFYDTRTYRYNNRGINTVNELATIYSWEYGECRITISQTVNLRVNDHLYCKLPFVGSSPNRYRIREILNNGKTLILDTSELTVWQQTGSTVEIFASNYDYAFLTDSADNKIYIYRDGFWWKEDNSGTVLITGDSQNIPEKEDAINIFNLVSNNLLFENNIDTAYRWNLDGDVGASGPNIKMKFSTRKGNGGESEDGYTLNGVRPAVWRILSYQRDEVYRYSIQFIDHLGRKSYPKWVLDCRMPNHGETDIADPGDPSPGAFAFVENSLATTRSIFPQFILKNVPKNPDGTYMKYRYLRVPRVGLDKTVYGTALVGPITAMSRGSANSTGCFDLANTKEYDSGYWAPPDGKGQQKLEKSFVEIISPEILMSDINLSNCIVKLVGTLDYNIPNNYYYRDRNKEEWRNFNEDPSNFQRESQIVKKLVKYSNPFTNTSPNTKYAKIKDYSIISPKPPKQSTHTVGGNVYLHMNFYPYAHGNMLAEHGTAAIATLDREFSFAGDDSDTTGLMFCLLKRDAIPYGGNTYNARLLNKYIPASDIFEGTDNLSASYRTCDIGDTYIAMFDYLRSQYSLDVGGDDQSYQEVFYFPTESQINLQLRSDDSFSKIYNSDYDVSLKLREDGLADIETGTEITALYKYNPVYSRENNTELFAPLQEGASESTFFDSRIRRSQTKFNGEYADSWLKFLQNDFLDVDSKYGQLVDLGVFSDRLLFFQETGFGTTPVGEKELIPSDTSNSLALGTGGILNRFDYLSTHIGAAERDAININQNGVYIYFNKDKTLYIYTNSSVPISDVKGLNSWFDENLIGNEKVTSGYDAEMRNIIFCFDSKILVYNEIAQGFIYFYPSEFVKGISKFIEFNGSLYSTSRTPESETNIAYKHNLGDRGVIHGDTYESSITLIVNPRDTIQNVWTVLEMVTDHLDSLGNEVPGTFTAIEVFNDYQSTGKIELIPNLNIKRRFRTWRFNKLRNSLPNRPRLRSTYIKIKLYYENSNNNQIVLHDLVSNFKDSKMAY